MAEWLGVSKKGQSKVPWAGDKSIVMSPNSAVPKSELILHVSSQTPQAGKHTEEPGGTLMAKTMAFFFFLSIGH